MDEILNLWHEVCFVSDVQDCFLFTKQKVHRIS